MLTSQFLLFLFSFLQSVRPVVTSGHLHWLLPLAVMLFPQIAACINASPLSSLCSNITFLPRRNHSAYNSSTSFPSSFIFIQRMYHHLINSMCYVFILFITYLLPQEVRSTRAATLSFLFTLIAPAPSKVPGVLKAFYKYVIID